MSQLFPDRKGIELQFFDACNIIVSENSLNLYDLEYFSQQQLLRLYIQNPETKTATIEECVLIDRALTPLFESEQWIPEDITLEVSSPGIYRELRTVEHFESSLGEPILVHFKQKLSGIANSKLNGKKKVNCILESVDSDGINVVADTENINFKFEVINKVNIEPAWDDIKAEQ